MGGGRGNNKTMHVRSSILLFCYVCFFLQTISWWNITSIIAESFVYMYQSDHDIQAKLHKAIFNLCVLLWVSGLY